MSIYISRDQLVSYVSSIISGHRVPEEDAQSIAKVLVTADARGIASHGVARLWRYLNGIDNGSMLIDCKPRIIKDTSITQVIDAQGGLGAPVSSFAMKEVIQKAKSQGTAFATVKNSNHFGIAGYYAMMAIEHDMIGIAMTNTAALGVPTFGCDVMFGTNPIAIAVPAGKEIPYVLDMSTTVVSRGKIEVYDRENHELPPGWAVNKQGLTAQDPGTLLKDMLTREGGGILPLGGEGDSFGGHKGYGLALLVDIFCALLSSSAFGEDISDSAETSARVSHFFGAIDIGRFRKISSFKQDMDTMLSRLIASRPAENQTQVYYAGLKEALAEISAESRGVELSDSVWEQVSSLGDTVGVENPYIEKRIKF